MAASKAIAPRPSIASERYVERLAKARAGLESVGAEALLIGVGADLLYLTGYLAMPLERLTMLVVPRSADPFLVAPALEAMRAGSSPAARAGAVEVVPWQETDNPHQLIAQRITRGAPARRRALVNPTLWASHVLPLQAELGKDWSLGLATPVLGPLRMVKDPEEVELLRLAAEAADRALRAIAEGRLIGRSEHDVSREVRARLIDEGHDEGLFAIVASGPNAASPHHEPGDRAIQAGEPVVLDIGGALGGYASDTTRTIWVAGTGGNGPDEEFRRIHELVRRASEQATAAVKPGARCEAVDAVARRVIAEGGYGPRFIHRVGHGIGLEGHEEPYLVGGSPAVLAPGTSFSIEPGIYLEGRYGVRIEDIVVCGDSGPIVLNALPRDLWVVEG